MKILTHSIRDAKHRMRFRISFTDIPKRDFNLVESIMVCWIKMSDWPS